METGLLTGHQAAEYVGVTYPYFMTTYLRLGLPVIRYGGKPFFDPKTLDPLKDKIEATKRIKAMRVAAEGAQNGQTP